MLLAPVQPGMNLSSPMTLRFKYKTNAHMCAFVHDLRRNLNHDFDNLDCYSSPRSAPRQIGRSAGVSTSPTEANKVRGLVTSATSAFGRDSRPLSENPSASRTLTFPS